MAGITHNNLHGEYKGRWCFLLPLAAVRFLIGVLVGQVGFLITMHWDAHREQGRQQLANIVCQTLICHGSCYVTPINLTGGLIWPLRGAH